MLVRGRRQQNKKMWARLEPKTLGVDHPPVSAWKLVYPNVRYLDPYSTSTTSRLRVAVIVDTHYGISSIIQSSLLCETSRMTRRVTNLVLRFHMSASRMLKIGGSSIGGQYLKARWSLVPTPISARLHRCERVPHAA
jgi:hypothetical protein